MSLLRAITNLWPRSEAERFADRMWPDRLAPQDVSMEPLVGDDSFHYCAPAAPAAVGDSPAGERIPQHMPPAGRSTWWCAECGKEMNTEVACVSRSQPGLMCSARCADRADGITDQAQLIIEVLGRYVAEFGSINSTFRITDVAKGIADRLERATPPAPFTHGDLAEAASIVDLYQAEPDHSDAERQRLRALSDRLDEGALPETGP